MKQTSADELKRLRSVYEGYRQDKRPKWGTLNLGNARMTAERNTAALRAVLKLSPVSLADRKILDIGCGAGSLLSFFSESGARDENLYGIDLLSHRIEEARLSYPAMHFIDGNAEQSTLPAHFFDIVTLFTVFSSILSSKMTRNLVHETTRVVRPGGFVMIYDFRVPSLTNRHTRPVRRRDVSRMFGVAPAHAQSITLLPQLARALGRFPEPIYRALAAVPFLRTHNLIAVRID